MLNPLSFNSTPASLDNQKVSTAAELAREINGSARARVTLVAAALSGTDVQSLDSFAEIEAVAKRAVLLADAALAEMER